MPGSDGFEMIRISLASDIVNPALCIFFYFGFFKGRIQIKVPPTLPWQFKGFFMEQTKSLNCGISKELTLLLKVCLWNLAIICMKSTSVICVFSRFNDLDFEFRSNETPQNWGSRYPHRKMIKVLCSNFQRSSCNHLWVVYKASFRHPLKAMLLHRSPPQKNKIGYIRISESCFETPPPFQSNYKPTCRYKLNFLKINCPSHYLKLRKEIAWRCGRDYEPWTGASGQMDLNGNVLVWFQCPGAQLQFIRRQQDSLAIQAVFCC